MRSSRRWLQIILGILVSGVALWFAALEVDGARLKAALMAADYRWLLPAIAVLVFGQLLRTWRWRLLFHRGSRPPWKDTFGALCVGYFVSTVFPLRLGDPLRAWAVGRSTRGSGSEALATVVVERILDLLSVVVLLAWAAPGLTAARLTERFGPGPWDHALGLRWLVVGGLLLCYMGLAALAKAGHRSDAVVARLLERSGLAEGTRARIRRLWSGWIDGLSPLSRPRPALVGLAASLLVWVVTVMPPWLIFRAFDLQLSFQVATFMICAVAFAAIVPSTPGYLGVYQWAVVWSLGLAAQVPPDPALAYALVSHAVTLVVLLALGPLGLRLLHLSRAELRRGMADSGAAGPSAAEADLSESA